MMARKGFGNIVNYLDDFLIVASSREECLRAQLTLIHLLHSLGFQVNWSKLSGPSQRVQFLGIQMNLITEPLVHGRSCNVFKKDNESIKNNGNAEKGHKVSISQWKQLINAVNGA